MFLDLFGGTSSNSQKQSSQSNPANMWGADFFSKPAESTPKLQGKLKNDNVEKWQCTHD